MKNLTTIIAGSLVALAFLALGSPAYAFESAADIQARLTELREIHADLKAQVEAGDITVEEAREKWHALLAETRAEKDAYFEEKMQQVRDRYEVIAERNPEAAELLKERIDLAKQRRDEHLAKREELRDQIESGDITRDEARQERLEFYQDQRAIYQEARQDIRDRARELRGEEFDRDDLDVIHPVDPLPPTGFNRDDLDIIRPIDPLRPDGIRPTGDGPTPLNVSTRPSTSIIDVAGVLGAQGKVDAANLGSGIIRPTLPPQQIAPANAQN